MNDSPIFAILKSSHSGIRWLLLISLLMTVVLAFLSMQNRNSVNRLTRRMALLSLSFSHLQLVFGFVLYFTSPLVVFHSSSLKHPVIRFFLVEHSAGMLIAITLITIGYIRMKRRADLASGSINLFWYSVIAFALILMFIPWPFLSYGGEWF